MYLMIHDLGYDSAAHVLHMDTNRVANSLNVHQRADLLDCLFICTFSFCLFCAMNVFYFTVFFEFIVVVVAAVVEDVLVMKVMNTMIQQDQT